MRVLLIGLLVFLTLGVGAQAAPPRACSDHVDNDGDGLVDYPADPGCDSRKDLDEYNAPEPPPPPPPPPGPAVLHTAVVLINFTNDQSQPWTPAQARSIVFDGPTSVAAFYLEASYGKQTLAGDVFGWWTVPYPNNPCDTLSWKNAARQMALAQGVNLDTDYDHVALVWPRSSVCGFNARAGSFYNGDFREYSVAHEVGHSFGLNHANGWRCTDASGNFVPLSTSCANAEYGDIFDTMGASLEHFNGWEKVRLGWLSNTQTITQSGRYTISPLEWQPQLDPQTLFISRADGSVFSLEFRQSYGFDAGNATDRTFNGVMIRVVPVVSQQTAQSFLIDAHPGGSLSWFDAPLTPGETLVDPLGGVSISIVSVGTSAVVDVEIGG